MVVDEPVYVMGHSKSAAHVAGIVPNFTDEVGLLTRGDDPEWGEETADMLANHPIDVDEEDLDDALERALDYDGPALVRRLVSSLNTLLGRRVRRSAIVVSPDGRPFPRRL